MLTRIHGKISFECDDCSDILETETRDFNDAMEKLREEEWRSQKRGQDWSHYCPMCWMARDDREDKR